MSSFKNPPALTPTYSEGSHGWFSTLTPSELAFGQELESPGGAVATAAASAPPRRHLCFTRRLLFCSGLIL